MKTLTKITILLLSVLVVSVRARRIPRPDFSIGLNFDHDAIKGSLGGASPRIRWDTDEISIAGLFDVQGGVESTLINLKEAPETYLWGEAKRVTGANAIAFRGDMNGNKRDIVDLDLRINSFCENLAFRALGSLGLVARSLFVEKIMASTSIDLPLGIPGSLKVNPRYDTRSKVTDTTVGYSLSKTTSFKLDLPERRFTLSRIFGKTKRNQLVPAISAGGKDLSVSYSRYLKNGSVTALWIPNHAAALKWSDGGWEAMIRAPLNGLFHCNVEGVKFSVRQNVGLSLF